MTLPPSGMQHLGAAFEIDPSGLVSCDGSLCKSVFSRCYGVDELLRKCEGFALISDCDDTFELFLR